VIALALRFALQRNLRGFGWMPGHPRYLLAGLAFPIVIGLGVHCAAWASGLSTAVPGQGGALALLGAILMHTVAFVIPILLFEELGWRGFLVPELAKFQSFGRVALVRGVVLALFHYPFLLVPAYAEVPVTVSGVLAFTVGIVAAAFPLAWLRLRSGSVWPVVLAHSAHNTMAHDVMSNAFQPTGPGGAAVMGESGWGLAVGYVLVAWWCWSRQRAEPGLG
jgi:membrane protease YdiL (CAAX protease family)